MGTNAINSQQKNPQPPEYRSLVELFNDWRDFEDPPRLNGAPDYTADRFKKDQNPEVFDKIEGSLERMMKQIDNLESVERVSFENYLSSQSQIIKLKED